jgi:DNA-binding response OmpR family regulator
MADKLDRRPEDVLIEALVEASGRGACVSYEFDVFRLEIDEQRLLRNGSPVRLAPKEFEILRLLIEHHGQLVSKQMLFVRLYVETDGRHACSVSLPDERLTNQGIGGSAAGAL